MIKEQKLFKRMVIRRRRQLLILGLFAVLATKQVIVDSLEWFPRQKEDRKRHKRKKSQKNQNDFNWNRSAEKSPFDLSVFVSDDANDLLVDSRRFTSHLKLAVAC